jgi:hypothetical protein
LFGGADRSLIEVPLRQVDYLGPDGSNPARACFSSPACCSINFSTRDAHLAETFA